MRDGDGILQYDTMVRTIGYGGKLSCLLCGWPAGAWSLLTLFLNAYYEYNRQYALRQRQGAIGSAAATPYWSRARTI
jgi:hypothetical protein